MGLEHVLHVDALRLESRLGYFGRDDGLFSGFQTGDCAPGVGPFARYGQKRDGVPIWITIVHVLFLAWTVIDSHAPPFFIGGFLFYLAFTEATEHHQDEPRLRPALLVGFFLAGLVVHGGLQGWWIEPLLTRLDKVPLFLGAMGLTAFNDNAAITYLASLVPGFGPALKYAVVAGAVAGGGLTVIANAPNPAGQSILAKFFPDGIGGRPFAPGGLVSYRHHGGSVPLPLRGRLTASLFVMLPVCKGS